MGALWPCGQHKCCIPQGDKEQKALCISHIEDFIHKSNGLIVLLSWNYFTRLWCVYEWACFLYTHHPSNVEIGCDSFLGTDPQATLPLYVNSIETLSVKNADCAVPGDREILVDKVFAHYEGTTPEESFSSFERFARCTALCLMAKQIIIWRAKFSEADELAWLGPIRASAKNLEYHNLCLVLNAAKPAKWFAQGNRDFQGYRQIVKSWFDNMAALYLIEERRRAVRRDFLNHERLGGLNLQPMLKAQLSKASKKSKQSSHSLNSRLKHLSSSFDVDLEQDSCLSLADIAKLEETACEAVAVSFSVHSEEVARKEEAACDAEPVSNL